MSMEWFSIKRMRGKMTASAMRHARTSRPLLLAVPEEKAADGGRAARGPRIGPSHAPASLQLARSQSVADKPMNPHLLLRRRSERHKAQRERRVGRALSLLTEQEVQRVLMRRMTLVYTRQLAVPVVVR